MVTENSAVPDKSLLAQYLPANYTDAYSKEVSGRDETTPEELMQAIFTHPSPLAGALMKLRNILVKPFGLETGSLEKPGRKPHTVPIGPGNRNRDERQASLVRRFTAMRA